MFEGCSADKYDMMQTIVPAYLAAVQFIKAPLIFRGGGSTRARPSIREVGSVEVVGKEKS